MNKKNSTALNALLDGLTGNQTQDTASKSKEKEESSTEQPEAKHTSTHTQRVCVLIEDEVLAKIRAISEKESISLSSIYNLGLKVVVENYESNHGKITPKQHKKGDIDKIFNI